MLGLDLSPSADLHRLRRLSEPWKTRSQLQRLSERPRPPGREFEFGVLGDVEPGRFWIFRALFNRRGVFERQLQALQGQSLDFTIQLGDMVSRGMPRRYLEFFGQLCGARPQAPYLTVIGNHDRSSPNGRSDSRLYRRIFGRSNYRFDYGGARFVVLDSSRRRLTRRQLRWLDAALDVPGPKLVFTHMPPVLLRLWDGSAAHRLGGFTGGAREFVELAARRRVDRVYMGHVHCFGVQDLEGVRYVLTGGGGSPLFPVGSPDRFHHYLTVAVGPHGIRERVHPLDGSSFLVPPGRVLIDR